MYRNKFWHRYVFEIRWCIVYEIFVAFVFCGFLFDGVSVSVLF
jgi:hypothetical protein